MYRHIKYVCKKNKDEDFKELARLMNEQNKKMELIHEEQQKTTKKLLFKDKELQKMQKQIERLTTKLQIQNINNGVIHQNQNNVVNIQLLNHTETDYSHLTHKDYVMCIHDCNKCVKSMIEKVHFNKDKPENRNIYISNIKGKYIMIYKDNAWQIIDKKEQLDDMYDYNEMVLEFWYDEYKTKYPDIVKSFQRYLKNKDGNDVLNKVKDEILMMLYNKRNMIMIEWLQPMRLTKRMKFWIVISRGKNEIHVFVVIIGVFVINVVEVIHRFMSNEAVWNGVVGPQHFVVV